MTRSTIVEPTPATLPPSDEHEGMRLYRALQLNLVMPFRTCLLGLEVEVSELEIDAGDCVMVVCTREAQRLRVPLQDLPLPTPAPVGGEWIHAWCRWHEGVELHAS